MSAHSSDHFEGPKQFFYCSDLPKKYKQKKVFKERQDKTLQFANNNAPRYLRNQCYPYTACPSNKVDLHCSTPIMHE